MRAKTFAKISIIVFILISFIVSCTKRSTTRFSKNLAKDQQQSLTQDEFIALVGKAKYDEMVASMGFDNFNRLSYGIGVSNTIELINSISNPVKLTQLMTGPNALNGGEVVDLLMNIDSQIDAINSPYNDTILKIANLINNVNNMTWMKDLVKGVLPHSRSVPALNPMQRLGRLIAGVNENLSTMPTLLNQIAPQPNGLAKLLKIINLTNDIRNLSTIINNVQQTSSIANLTSIIGNLGMDDACSINPPTNNTQQKCIEAGGTWLTHNPDATDVLVRIINEAGNCSNSSYASDYGCTLAGHTWSSKALDLATIVNNLTQVENLNEILNSLTYDDKSAGEPGDIMTGTDAMIATIKIITDINKLTAVVNQLALNNIGVSNDDNFEVATISDTNMLYAAGKRYSDPGDGWALTSDDKFSGLKSLGSQPIKNNEVASLAMRARIEINGNITFNAKINAHSSDCLKFYIDDLYQGGICGNINWASYSYPITVGTHLFRWEFAKGNGGVNYSGKAWIDDVILPGNRGAARTPAQKVAIMMNKLMINSITNVGEILNGLNSNGISSLVGIINRTQYPEDINQTPNLIIIVNQLDTTLGVNTLVTLLNGLTPQGFRAITQIVDNISHGDILVNMINGLFAGVTGEKVYQILNDLDAQGIINLVTVFDAMRTFYPSAYTAGTPGATGGRNSKLLEDLLNGVTATALLATAMNELDLNGRNIAIGSPIGTSAVPTGGRKLANVILQVNNRYNSGTGIWVANHLVRLLNEMNALDPTNGARNVARIISDLDPSITPNGVNRMADILLEVKNYGTCNPTTGVNCYRNSTWDLAHPASADHFGRLTNLIIDMGGNGAKNIAKLVNTVLADRLDELAFLVKNTNRIKYISRVVSEAGHVQMIADIINAPNLNISKVQDLLNDMGNNTANFGDPIGDQRYTNQWMWPTVANDVDKLGRLIQLINGVTGGAANVVQLISDVNVAKMPILQDIIKEINRIGYLTRLMNEATNINLVISLINNSPNKVRLLDLLNSTGNQTYGNTIGTVGSYTGNIYGSNPSGSGCATMPGFADGKGCDTNTTDRLGKVIVMINEITNITDTISLVNDTQDFNYVKDLIRDVNRIRYLTHIINNLQNVDLMLKIINGADACTVYVPGVNTTTDTAATCTTAGGTWFGVGRCITHPSQTTRAGCLGVSGIWRGAEYNKLLSLINGVGDSRLRGNVNQGDLIGNATPVKAVGDMLTLYDTVNKLGYNGSTARTAGQQVRVVRVINGVEYCGIRPAFDKYIQYGPTCVNSSNVIQHQAYQYREACEAAGFFWRSSASTNGWQSVLTHFYPCDKTTYTKPTTTPVNGGYYNNNDPYDGRPRTLNVMLNMNDGLAMSYIIGDVQDTGKTINIMNGSRRIRTISLAVKWMPGQVTARLVNDTHPAAIMRAFNYLANNLDDDEDEAAKVFAQMIHFGTRVVAQSPHESDTPACLEFTAIGPGRLARILNLEAGPYLEGLLAALGPHISIAIMNCGFARDSDENTTHSACTSPPGFNAGGMVKSVGASYTGDPKPSGSYCVTHQEVTAGYKYGNYSWAGDQGVNSKTCRALLPNDSGATIFYRRTDRIVWEGWCPFGCVDDGMNDIWEMLKGNGSGILGWVMDSSSSALGFPNMRGFNNTNATPNGAAPTVLCTSDSYNNNNWQCIREGLKAGDLSTGPNGRHWGGFCSGASTTSGTGSTVAQRCYHNGGRWKPMKNYQSTTCKLDPSVDPPILAP